MRLLKIHVNLTYVKTGDHPDVVLVAFRQEFTEFISLQEGRFFLTVERCLAKCRNATAAKLYHICMEFFQHSNFEVHIHACVNVPQIVLNHAVFVFCPPHLFFLSMNKSLQILISFRRNDNKTYIHFEGALHCDSS